MSNINSISIFFPCYNDKGTIKKLIDDATETVHNLNINDYEIIVTDDGSIDGARELLASLQETNPRLKVVFHEHNQGYAQRSRVVLLKLPRNGFFTPTGTRNTMLKN